MYLDKKTCSKLREKIEKMVELFLGKLGSDWVIRNGGKVFFFSSLKFTPCNAKEILQDISYKKNKKKKKKS